MRARALESFEFAKIGLNIHHPIAGLVGRRWRGISSHGDWSGVIPKPIYPQIHLRTEGWDLPIFPPVHELWLDHEAGVLRFDFAGRAYEMEDHRNWSDQSLKTYSMPAETGYRHQIAKNDELAEHLRVSFSPHAARSRRRGRTAGPPTVSASRIQVGTPLRQRMPTIGLIQAGPLRESEAHLLELIHPAHLRLEVDLAAPDWGDHLAAGLDACARIGAAAELALFLVRDPRVPLTHLGEIVRERGASVTRVLAFVRDEDATSPSWPDLVRESLTVEAPIGGGAHMNFAELNRAWPDMRGFDVLAYPLSPQVHATSDLSLIENLEAQAEQVWTARRRIGRRALAVGPVTLEPRWRPAPVPDARQQSLFGAAWTLGSIKMLAGAGCDSVTFCDTTGPRGAVNTTSELATAHPLLHILADAARLTGSEILSCHSGEEPWLCGLATRNADCTTILIANLADIERTVRIHAPDVTKGWVRLLDDTLVPQARLECQEFRSDLAPLESGELTMDSYATAYVELR